MNAQCHSTTGTVTSGEYAFADTFDPWMWFSDSHSFFCTDPGSKMSSFMTQKSVRPFRLRWLGKVRYRDALAVQRAICSHSFADYLLLLEHHPVYTLGNRASLENLLTVPSEVGAEIEQSDRGGDVTFHGPGQLVGYPLLHLPGKRGGGMADTAAYVDSIESLLIQVCEDLGLKDVGRLTRYPGVWVNPSGDNPRKIAAIGVRISRARSMHGFALNVNCDLSYFSHMIPCGIKEYGVTSLALEGVEVDMTDVIDRVAEHSVNLWAKGPVDRAYVSQESPLFQLDSSKFGKGFDEEVLPGRKPKWMKVTLETGPQYRHLKKIIRENNLNTVCEEAGCPNIFDCWNEGTATFMINGDRCTRACGFCQVDTRKPVVLDEDEPWRVAEAISVMGLKHAVVTSVARDDLADGGASAFAATVLAIRKKNPATTVEVLIPDCKGDPESLEKIFAVKPDVLNHNIETVARLQRQVRPSAGYARSLSVLARASKADLTTKSSIIVGLGERDDEVESCLADLAAVDCDIVTIGQYLQPTDNHLPIDRWVEPKLFERWHEIGEELGITHVEAGPLTRSSYHAQESVKMVLKNTELTEVKIRSG